MLLAADFLNIAPVQSKLLSELSTGNTGSAHMQHTNDVWGLEGVHVSASYIQWDGNKI